MVMNDGVEVDTQLLDQKIEIEKLIQILLLSSDIPSSVSSDPQFVESVGKLSQLRLYELTSIPQRIQKDEDNLRHKMEQLAIENYPIFLTNAKTSREVHREFLSISDSNNNLLSSIAKVSSVAQTIFDNIGKNASGFRTSAKSAQKYTQISEFLELPQLMETCIHNGYYQDALNILNHTKKMAKKYGRTIPIARMVGLQAQDISGQLFSQLCKQLRQPITLPACLKVVIYLRQLEAFSEHELRLHFLQSRGVCIKDQIEFALAKPIGISNFDPKLAHLSDYQQSDYNAFIRTIRRIEVTRVQLFDSITQYRAVFADEEGYANKLPDQHQQRVLADISPLHLDEAARTLHYVAANQINDLGFCNEASLFHAWLVRQIGIFLDGLSEDLSTLLNLPRLTPSEISDRIQLAMANDAISLDNVDASAAFQQIHSVMTQAFYFGRSFARIGCDFRAHLGTIFSRHILTYFETCLRNALTELSVVIDLWPRELVEPPFLASQSVEINPGELQAPLAIARYPAIAFFCNRILSAFNGLRICCPVALRDGILSVCTRTLSDAASTIVLANRTQQLDSPSTRAQNVRLASIFAHVATPHLLTCLLEHIFGGDAASHLWQLHQDNGEDDEILTTSQYISRISTEVCTPIFAVWGQLTHGPLPEDQSVEPDPDNRRYELPSERTKERKPKVLEQTIEAKLPETLARTESHQMASEAPLVDSPCSDKLEKEGLMSFKQPTPKAAIPNEDQAAIAESTSTEQKLVGNENEPPNSPIVTAVQPFTVHEDTDEILKEQKVSTEGKIRALSRGNEEFNKVMDFTVSEETDQSLKLKGDPISLEMNKHTGSLKSGSVDSVHLADENLEKAVVSALSSAELPSEYEGKTAELLCKAGSTAIVPSDAEKTTLFTNESRALPEVMIPDLKDDHHHKKLKAHEGSESINLNNRLSDENFSSNFFQIKDDQEVEDENIQQDQIPTLSLPPDDSNLAKFNVAKVEPELSDNEEITSDVQFIGLLAGEGMPATSGEHFINATGGNAFSTHIQKCLPDMQYPKPFSPTRSETVNFDSCADTQKTDDRPSIRSDKIIADPNIGPINALNVAMNSAEDFKSNDWEGKPEAGNDEEFGGVLSADAVKNTSSAITSKTGLFELEELKTEDSLAKVIEEHLKQTETAFASQKDPIEMELVQGYIKEGVTHSEPDAREADNRSSNLSEVLLEAIMTDKHDFNDGLSNVNWKSEPPETSKIEEGLKSPLGQCRAEVPKKDEDTWAMNDDGAWNKVADSDGERDENEKVASSQSFVDNCFKAYQCNPLVGGDESSDLVESSGITPELDESVVIRKKNPTKSLTETFSPIEMLEQRPSKANDVSDSPGKTGFTLQDLDTIGATVIPIQILEPQHQKSNSNLSTNNSSVIKAKKGPSDDIAGSATWTQSSGFFKEVDSSNLVNEQSIYIDSEWIDNHVIDAAVVKDSEEAKFDIEPNMKILRSTGYRHIDTVETTTRVLSDKQNFKTEGPKYQVTSELSLPSSFSSTKKSHSEDQIELIVPMKVPAGETEVDTEDSEAEKNLGIVETEEFKVNTNIVEPKESEGDREHPSSMILTIPDTVEKQNVKIEAPDYRMTSELIESSSFSPSKCRHSEVDEKSVVRENSTEAYVFRGEGETGWIEGTDIDNGDLEAMKTIDFVETGEATDDFRVHAGSHRFSSPTYLDTAKTSTETFLEVQDFKLDSIDDRTNSEHIEFTVSSVSEEHFGESENPSLQSSYPPEPVSTWTNDNVLKDEGSSFKHVGPALEDIQVHPAPDMLSDWESHSSDVDAGCIVLEGSARDKDCSSGKYQHESEPDLQESGSIPQNPAGNNIVERSKLRAFKRLKRDTDEEAKDPIDSYGCGENEDAWGGDAELPLGEIELGQSILGHVPPESGDLVISDIVSTSVFSKAEFEDGHPKDNFKLLADSEATSTSPGLNPTEIRDVLMEPPKVGKLD